MKKNERRSVSRVLVTRLESIVARKDDSVTQDSMIPVPSRR
jgi:hypothetical protein